MNMMKKFLALLLGATMVVGLTACRAGEEPASNDNQTVTETPAETPAETKEETPTVVSSDKTVITYWNGFTGTDGEVMQKIIDNYNASNDLNVEIQMERVSWDTLYQQLATSLPVGEGPDITAFATERIGGYAESGAIVPIDDVYKSSQVDSSKIPTVFNENLQYNGNYYGVPVNIASLILYYNKDIFDKANIEYPNDGWTWDDLEKAALALTKDEDGEHQYGFGMATNNTIQMWPIMIWAGCGDFIQNGKSVFNSPENVKTITRWADLIRNNKIGPEACTGADIDTLFSTGKLGMYFCGPWAAGSFDAAGVNYGMAGVPAGPAGKATLAQGIGMYMTSSAKEEHKKGIYDFFAYWQSVDAQVEWSGSVGFPVTNTDAAADARLASNEAVALFSDQVQYAHFYLQQLTNFNDIDVDVIVPALERILLEGADVQKTLDDATAQMDQLLGN
jgi:multiple sugar transport system substrate-binding protein